MVMVEGFYWKTHHIVFFSLFFAVIYEEIPFLQVVDMVKRDLSFGDAVLEHISKSIPSMMSSLAALILLLILTAPSIQSVNVNVDGLQIIDIDTDKCWITITVLEVSGNLTFHLVRAGNHLTPRPVVEGYKGEWLVRYEEGKTTPYLVLNGTGWVHFIIEGYSERVNVVFW